MKQTGIIISCYDKVDDLMAHLDILDFTPYEKRLIVVYMHDDDPPEMPKNVDLLRLPSPGFTSGPLLSLTHGIRHAAGLGLEWVVFRNADDWLFNHAMTQSWIEEMEARKKLASGYCWFGVNTFNDITLNENILNVPHFQKTIVEAERYFASSDQAYNCEYKMAWWMRRSLPDLSRQFFRLPGREQEPGIGWENKDLPIVYSQRNESPPSDWMMKLLENERFFNRKWQLIGSHDNASRLGFWNRIKNEVPYASELMKKEQFARWHTAATDGTSWNKPHVNVSRATRTIRRKPVRTKKSLPRKLLFSKDRQSVAR